MTNSTFWQTLLDCTIDVGVGADGSAWAIGSEGQVYQWIGATWSRVAAEKATRIALDGEGKPWIVSQAGGVFQRNGEEWTPRPPPVLADDIGVSPSGAVWMTGKDFSIHRWNGTSFENIDGGASRVAVGPNDVAWVVGGAGTVYRRNGNAWTAIPAPSGGANDIGVGADGTVWISVADGKLHRLDAATSNWVACDLFANSVTVGPGGMPWAIRRDHNVVCQRQFANATFLDRDAITDAFSLHVLPNSLARDVSVGPEGTTWMIGTDSRIYQFAGNSWAQISGLGLRIAVGPNDQPWLVGTDRQIWRVQGDVWTPIFGVPSGGEDIAVGPSGIVWVTAVDHSIHFWNGTSLTRIDGGAYRIAVDANDLPWVIGTDRAIFRRLGNAWLRIEPPSGGASDIGIGLDGTVCIAGMDGRAYRLNDERTGWIICQAPAQNIAVGPDGTPWASAADCRILRLTPSRFVSSSRDFIMSLWWEYIGRAPDNVGLDWHHARILNGSITRASLAAEFANCVESRQRFVTYLFWRYLGRGPSVADVNAHVAIIANGQYTKDSLEEYIRNVPEAKAYGAPGNQDVVHGCSVERDFVLGLYWRYLGRDADPQGLDGHFFRIRSKSITNVTLEEEFRTCPEARAYAPVFAPLEILSAAYTGAIPGQEDVTAKVRAWVCENRIVKAWQPTDLGAPAGGGGHVLVIVYRYGNGPARTLVRQVGWSIEIGPRQDERLQTERNRAIALGSKQFTILSAVYGRRDVTTAARTKANADRLYVNATDAEWGHAGPVGGLAKSLVVIYQVGNGPPIVYVTPNGKRAFVNAPPLQILGATYGQVDATAAIAAQVRGGTLEVQADLRLVGFDPWSGVWKTVVVVYRYGDETNEASVVIAKDQDMINITPPEGPLTPAPKQEFGLYVFGAAYGLANVTNNARRLEDYLEVRADDATWGDGWPGRAKTLTIVYQVDGGRPLVASVMQNQPLAIGAPMILGAAYGPLDVTDKVATIVRGGKLAIVANDEIFGDTFIGQDKTLVVVYRYDDEMPRVGVVTRGSTLTLSTRSIGSPVSAITGLQILGAAYGPKDITALVRYSDRDFVNSLFWRYIGRAPTGAPELDHHVGRVVSGSISTFDMETEFRNCPEAQQHGAASDNDFVVSLYWRYLGRAPDPSGLANHLARFVAGTISRSDLEEEFRTCTEAVAYTRAPRTFVANNSSWGDTWPGRAKSLVVVYRFGAEPPRMAIALADEQLTLPLTPIPSAAYVLAQVRLLHDYQVPPNETITVIGPVPPVPAITDPSSAFVPQPNSPTRLEPIGVHQVVLIPRRRDGSPILEGTRLTVVSTGNVDILTDQSGQTTLYKLSSNVPLEFVVPTSGRCRFSVAAVDGPVNCPLLRVRWSEMAENAWAVVALDQDLHKRMADLTRETLLNPPPGKTTLIASTETSRAHALENSVGKAMRACLDTQLRLRTTTNRALRVPDAVDLGKIDLSAGTRLFVPPHVIIKNGTDLSRAVLTGATAFYALRTNVGEVEALSWGDIGGAFESIGGAVGSAFRSGFDAVASVFTTAFDVTLGGIAGVYRSTVEGMQSLVTVAEKLAVTVGSFTADTYANAQCVLVDTTNGLVAYAVTVANGVASVSRMAISTIEDVALLITEFSRRIALQVKQIIEFLLMMLDWGDVLETQRYLANVINAELTALPGVMSSATGYLGSSIDQFLALAPPTNTTAPILKLPTADVGLGPLGDAFDFLFDRLLSGVGGGVQLNGSQLDDTLTQIRNLTPSLASEISHLDIARISTTTDPVQLLDLLRQFVHFLLGALRASVNVAANAVGTSATLIRQVLDTRIEIPVLTEIVEFLILGGGRLTLLNLATLLSGAAYTYLYKALTRSTHGPFHNAQPCPPLAAIVLEQGQPVAMSFAASEDSSQKSTVFGLQLTGGITGMLGFLFRGNPFGQTCGVISSTLGIVTTCAQPDAFGTWFPVGILYNVSNLLSTLMRCGPTTSIEVKNTLVAYGVAETALASTCGIGLLGDELGEKDVVTLRMTAGIFSGLAGITFGDNAVSRVMMGASGAARVGLATDQTVRYFIGQS